MANSLNEQVDLKILSAYKYTLDSRDVNLINYKINNIGLTESIEYYLDELDVTKHQFIQTIHFRYKCCIASLYYCFDLLSKDSVGLYSKHLYINRLLNTHKSNLEYEIINPPIIYEKKKKAITKTKSNKILKANKTSKDTKLKARITIVNLETNKEITLDRDLALSVIKDKPNKFKIKDE